MALFSIIYDIEVDNPIPFQLTQVLFDIALFLGSDENLDRKQRRAILSAYSDMLNDPTKSFHYL